MKNLKQLLSRIGAMKTALLSLALIICCLWAAPAKSQPILYGVSLYGGSYGDGALYHYDVSTGNFTLDLSFTHPDSFPIGDMGSLFQACNGKFYGLSENGGTYNQGTLYDFDPLTGILHIDTSFNGFADNYMAPAGTYGTLMQASNGLMYGTTSGGGEFYKGTIFSFDPITDSLKVVFNFNGTDGEGGYGKLIQATNGKLYGMTQLGGNNDLDEGDGTIFEFDINTGILTTDVIFNNTISSGRSPYGSLVQASNGLMYGLTYSGGINSNGVLFEFDPFSRNITYQVDLGMTTGFEPHGSLIEASNGKLYGTASLGGTYFNYEFDTVINNTNEQYYSDGGTIFDYDPVSHTITTDYNFNFPVGTVPYGDLLQLPNGKLYGTTYNGGGSYFNQGTIFDFDITTNIMTVDHYFGQGSEGGGNWCSLVQYNPAILVNPDVPTLTPDQGTICQGAPVLISVTSGNLNNANNWQWYSGFCGGTPVGTGTSILVTPSITTTYFARGEGGCITPGDCGAVTITVNQPPAPTVYGGPAFCESGLIGTEVYNGYLWNDQNNSITQTISVNTSATYTVTVTDINGCTASASEDIVVGQNPTANAGPDKTTCSNEASINLFNATGTGSFTWSTSGDGYFNNDNILDAEYNAGQNDIANGTVELTLTAVDPTGSCITVVTDQMTLTIITSPQANAGGNQIMCTSDDSIILSNASGTDALLWLNNGDGHFNDPTIANPTYYPGTNDYAAGSVILNLYSHDPTFHCDSVSDQMTLTITPPPIAYAGGDQYMCSTDASYTLVNASGTGHFIWSSSGDGFFDNPHILHATYYPGPLDLYSDIILTLTANGTEQCPGFSTDYMILSIITNTSAYAGGPFISMCASDNSVNLSNATYVGQGTINWITSGDGHFDNPTVINPNYFPGPQDITFQVVELTLTTLDYSVFCPISNDVTSLLIGIPTSSFAGFDQLLCPVNGYLNLGQATGIGTSFLWATTGDGYFDNNTELNPNYYPGTNDITTQYATVTLTAFDNFGTCPLSSSQELLTIITNHDADAGGNLGECGSAPITINGSTGTGTIHWLTQGDGTFNNPDILHPTYYPGTDDIYQNGVTLTLTTYNLNQVCPLSEDSLRLAIGTITSADAGSNLTMCASDYYTIIDATANGSVQWLSLGDGNFYSPYSAFTEYVPGTQDILNGGVELVLLVQDPAGICSGSTSSMFLTIDTNFNANAGGDLSMCASSPSITITNSSGSGEIIWISYGDGSFDDQTIIHPTYTPGPNDILNNSVRLVLETTNPNFLCPNSIDYIYITIGTVPSANAGNDQSMCATDVTININDASVVGLPLWEGNNDDHFDNPQSLNTNLTPGQNAVFYGTDQIDLYAFDPAGICPAAHDYFNLTVITNHNANAGNNLIMCSGDFEINMSQATGSGTILWTTDGDGSFDDPAYINSTYYPGPNDINDGGADLTLTTTNLNDPCPLSSSTIYLMIISTPSVNAGGDQTMCSSDGSITLSNASGTGNIRWTTLGDGTFDDPTLINAVYHPGNNDILDQATVLSLGITDPTGNCYNFDNMFLTINTSPVSNAGSDQTICSGAGSITLSDASGSGNFNWISSGDGSFNNSSALHPTFYPGSWDISNGSVSLILQAIDPLSLCPTSGSVMILTINTTPIANAGGHVTICSSETSVTLSNANATGTILWTTLGDGTFDDPTVRNPVYHPGSLDILEQYALLNLVTTDISGNCISTDEMDLSISPAPSANAGGNLNMCSGAGSITISNATGTGEFSWTTDGDGTFDNNSLLHPTYYPGSLDIINGGFNLFLKATDNAGACSIVYSNLNVNIISPPTVSISANGPTTICTGGSVTLDAGNYSSYTWSDGSTNETLIATASGTYYVTVTNSNGCIGIGSLVVTVLSVPTPVITANGSTTICQGSSVTLDAGSYTSYNWNTGAHAETVNASSAGIYTVTVTNAGGCTGVASTSVIVNLSPTPIITAYGSIPFCQGSSVILDAGGVYSSYLWSNGSNIESQVITSANTYSVTVSDPDGCTGVASQVVTVNPLPTPSITANGPTTFCIGGSVTLNAGVYNEYVWSNNTFNETTLVNSAGLYSVTVTDGNNCTGVASQSITILPVPVQPGAITGNTNICHSTSNTYSISPVAGALSYTWILPSGWTGNSNSTSITTIAGTSDGNISVTANNSCGPSISSSLAVTVNAGVPSQPGQISGPTSVCHSSTQTYFIAPVSSASSYIWTLPNGWTGVSNSTSITVSTGNSGGNISVKASNGCGNSTIRTLAISIIPNPPQPGVISGNTSVCSGTSQTYSIAQVAGASGYTWTLPSGWSGNSTTTSITVTSGATGGNIAVKANNDCGSSANRTLAVTVTNVPPTPGAITGSTTVCPNTSQTYSIANVTGALSYTWTLPSGWSGNSNSNSITLITGSNSGTISVAANNGCGTGLSRSLSITINQVPAQPGSITGNTIVCSGTSQSYSVIAVPGATSYTWSLPPGWAGSSVSRTINATAGSSGGTISVSANNTCGNSLVQTLFVTSNSIPSTPVSISGNTSVCKGSVQVYSISPVAGASSYIWTLPSGWSGSSTSTEITCTIGTISGNISVKATNNCGNSPVKTLAVTVNTITTVTITSNPTDDNFCSQVSPTSVTLTASAGYTSYTWSPGGANTQAITVNSVNTYMVTVANAAGCTTSASKAVTNNCALPTSLSTTNILGTSAKANWVQSQCRYNYTIQISIHGMNNWTQHVISPATAYTFTGLSLSTSYDWQIQTNCNTSGTINSGWSAIQTFTTLSSRMAEDGNANILFNIYPNPANSMVTIAFSTLEEGAYNIRLVDMIGRVVVSEIDNAAQGENSYIMNLDGIAKGVYMIILQKGDNISKGKLIVE